MLGNMTGGGRSGTARARRTQVRERDGASRVRRLRARERVARGRSGTGRTRNRSKTSASTGGGAGSAGGGDAGSKTDANAETCMSLARTRSPRHHESFTRCTTSANSRKKRSIGKPTTVDRRPSSCCTNWAAAP